MSILNNTLLDKLDYDSKFEIVKQLVKQKPLIDKFKFLYEFNDPRLIAYFKDKFIIPVNISSFEDDLPLLNENMSLTRFISKHNFTLKDDFFIYWITDCYKKCDIPILEWWLYSGIYNDGNLNKSIDLVYVISKKRMDFDVDLSVNNLSLSNTVLPDLEVLEWFSRNNFKILGAFNLFVHYFLFYDLLSHSIWILNYIKKSSFYKNDLATLFQSTNELAFIFYDCAFHNNHRKFNWLLLSGFPFNQSIYDVIKSYAEVNETTHVLKFFDSYKQKLNI